jgi:hypothetical protein
MTDPTAAPTPTAGLWRRLWRFIEACEMSSAEHRDLRIDALERRVAELRQALRKRGPASAAALQENSPETASGAIGVDLRASPQNRI